MHIPGSQVGFIAEDMIKVIPEVVAKDAEGKPENVDYAKLTSVLTKAIQQMWHKIEQLFEHDKEQDARAEKQDQEIKDLKEAVKQQQQEIDQLKALIKNK